MFYSKYQKDLIEYINNPNKCKNCGNEIYPDENNDISKVKKMCFCCASCKDEYNKKNTKRKGIEIKSGIYYIKNILNDKIYVGQTKHLNLRYGQHKYKLKNGKHTNYELQDDWNSYGEECFEFGILERCTEDYLDEREEFWIKKMNAYDENYGYNRNVGGSSGYISDEKTKKMRSDNHSNVNGESNSNSKLTWDIVKDIRRKLRESNSVKDIANEFGVSESTIRKIKNNKIWKEE